ncbi:glycosyltransferase family 4 protein [Undibacterium parvum]|uniref:Glycosyltransferase family 1 protein n=1 Tax=Undibacterium parvum TaxID=401471 RepID=A0A3Q9BQU6_9BURK|nr:glycosyltransferase family 4 protein [Undibacterium parvum]AZP12221.1 glycosyltransferase family 1 protein [Undibacterium parvum]
MTLATTPDANRVSSQSLRIALVGPLPPSSGGMANQTLQLAKLLRADGLEVELVQVNRAYPSWVAHVKGVRALFRLLPYLRQLWSASGKADLLHIMANSGWSWHLFAAPAIWIAHLRGTPVIVNYRGGEAASFFQKDFSWVKPSLHKVESIIVPSGFLDAIFKEYGFTTKIVPNIIDFSRFFASELPRNPLWTEAPRLLVARNLELIYDNATALRAFKIIHERLPQARLTIAGSGPELANLLALSQQLHLSDAVTFAGRIDNHDMPQLYRDADMMLNPTTADNMPISILEALASGIPVVSTDVGGIPYLVQHEKTALLVAPGAPQAMAEAVLSLLNKPEKAQELRQAGVELVTQYTWSKVRLRLLAVYAEVATFKSLAKAKHLRESQIEHTD